MSNDSRTAAATSPHSAARATGLPASAVALLLLTAAISLVWSHYKLLGQDEMFSLQTDGVATVGQLVHIQRTFPISLDPLVYHLISHAAMRVFGVGPFALRVGAFIGFLLMQVCLFFFVRRCFHDPRTGERAGLVALAFPAMTSTLMYSAEGRPYGLLLGLYALTLVSWQTVTRITVTSRSSNRTAVLITLAVSIGLTLNTHYFGVLLLVPLCAAELFRIFERRRVDLGVAAAIFTGMAAIVFTLPFQKAAGEFRQHYYNAGSIGLHAITQSYRALLVDYTRASLLAQHVAAALFVLFAVALIAGSVVRLRSRTLGLPAAEAVFVVMLAALPFFGFLLARFVTHSIEVRYVLGAILGVAILLALVVAPAFERGRNSAWLVPALFAALAATGWLHIVQEKRASAVVMAALRPSPELKAAILASPTQRLYIQDMGDFQIATYYQPDPFVRSHMTLVYSRDQELRWDKHDTVSLTAEHMRFFTGFSIVPYEAVRAQPGEHIFILVHSGWDWTDEAFAEAHATLSPLGPTLRGEAASVRFVDSPR